MGEPSIRVLLIASNPEYAGLERHVSRLIEAMSQLRDVEPHLVVFHEGQLVEEVRALGVPIEVVTLRWVFDVTAISRLARTIRRWKIDCLHTYGYKANVIGTMAARWAGVKAIVCAERGKKEPFYGFDWLKMEVYEALNFAVSNILARRIITPSNELRKHFAPRYPLTKVVTVHNGIRPLAGPAPKTVAEIRASLGASDSTPLIGIVGRLKPVKGHSDFLKAASIVSEKLPDASFVVLGDGPLMKPLRDEAAASGLNGRVHFVGFKADVLDWTAALDLLVFASHSEGIPNALLEAMSLGVPVVSTAVGGVPEVIEDGMSGILVPPRDPEALAQVCLELLNDPGRRQMMALAGRERCHTCFSDLRMAQNTRDVYLEALASKGQLHASSHTSKLNEKVAERGSTT